MKLPILFTSLLLLLGFVGGLAAQTREKVTLEPGQRKSVDKGRLRIKFVSVEEDSRCPEGVNCIWAGNVRIKVQVKVAGKRVETFELNSNLKPKMFSLDGYQIEFVGLAPAKKADKTASKDGLRAEILVSRGK